MRIPTDRTLARWIRELIEDDRLYRFYKTKDWLELRERVMAENNHECVRCREKQPAVYARAQTVHHVNEVRQRPDLALSLTFVDAEGVSKPNLLPLCNRCHNEVHGRFYGAVKRPQLNEERW